MKKCVGALLVISIISCNGNDSSRNLTTVDSNVAGVPDSMPSNVYLDSFRKDTSVTIALDSAGPTISPQDTFYSNKR